MTSSKVSNVIPKLSKQAVAGRSVSKGGLNVEDMKHVLDWNNVTYTSGSSRSGLEQLLSSLLNEIDAANNRQTEATPEAWDSITDPSLRSFQELLVDGPDTQVAIEARYNNWRGEEELLISHVSWAQIATIADEHSRAGADSESKTRRLTTSSLSELDGDISFMRRVREDSRGSVDYTVSIKVGSKRSAGTKDTITIQMIGSQGRVSGYATLGNNWKPGDERSMVLSGLKEVGAVVQVELTTSGNDGVDSKKLGDTHGKSEYHR